MPTTPVAERSNEVERQVSDTSSSPYRPVAVIRSHVAIRQVTEQRGHKAKQTADSTSAYVGRLRVVGPIGHSPGAVSADQHMNARKRPPVLDPFLHMHPVLDDPLTFLEEPCGKGDREDSSGRFRI